MRMQRYSRNSDGVIKYEKIELPTEDHHVAVIDDDRLMALPEYSTTIPTGAHPNKMWRRRIQGDFGAWLVCEYVPHDTKLGKCRIVARRATSPEAMALVAEGVLWWLGA